MSGKLFRYARVSVASDADANNLENQRRVLVDCEQVFEDVGSGASWNRPGLNRLKATLQPGDCVKGVALDRLGRSLTEVMDLLGWLREKGVEIISLRESIDQDSAMGRAMLHLAIVFAEMERDLARERTLAGLERVKATGKHLGRRKGVSRKRAEEITEHAPARRPLMGPHRHDNRVALQQHPPDLHLGPRRDSADRLRSKDSRLIRVWEVAPFMAPLAAESNCEKIYVHMFGLRARPRAGQRLHPGILRRSLAGTGLV